MGRCPIDPPPPTSTPGRKGHSGPRGDRPVGKMPERARLRRPFRHFAERACSPPTTTPLRDDRRVVPRPRFPSQRTRCPCPDGSRASLRSPVSNARRLQLVDTDRRAAAGLLAPKLEALPRTGGLIKHLGHVSRSTLEFSQRVRQQPYREVVWLRMSALREGCKPSSCLVIEGEVDLVCDSTQGTVGSRPVAGPKWVPNPLSAPVHPSTLQSCRVIKTRRCAGTSPDPRGLSRTPRTAQVSMVRKGSSVRVRWRALRLSRCATPSDATNSLRIRSSRSSGARRPSEGDREIVGPRLVVT